MTKLAYAPLFLLAATALPLSAQDTGTQPGTQAPPATATVAAATADPNAQICRVQEVTGSHVRKRKVCRTAAEWRRLSDDHRGQAQEYVDHGRGGSNGN
ncbi:hypothetical protein [Porphyrobacter sp. GA68]|uniref:hypothetical protein n=1 Tax=Porphyrobacter sp. GA68 TaxID=2883480 RepID=UPI001D19832A|nr:hypothetical protein [Porphyrobacter sp. GA68]